MQGFVSARSYCVYMLLLQTDTYDENSAAWEPHRMDGPAYYLSRPGRPAGRNPQVQRRSKATAIIFVAGAVRVCNNRICLSVEVAGFLNAADKEDGISSYKPVINVRDQTDIRVAGQINRTIGEASHHRQTEGKQKF